jgi:hypothetical protein
MGNLFLVLRFFIFQTVFEEYMEPIDQGIAVL